MTGIGVLEGGDKGDFQPNSILTREQAAKIICYMLLGKDTAEKLTTNSAVFKDVAANRWSAPFIGYCVNLGILAGDGNGNFFPEGKLTGAAFAKMLLVALGYDANIENYVGNDWVINVSSAAISAGIAPSGVVLSNELSRQDAAQMAFQTLTADMVRYSNKGTTINNADGSQIVIGAVRDTLANNAVTETIENDDVMQFAEQYFAKLKKASATTDEGLAGYKWQYNSKDISGAYTDAVLVDTLGENVATITKGQVYSNYSFDKNSAGAYENINVFVNGTADDAKAVSDIAVRGSNAKALDTYKGAEIKLYDTDKDGSVDTAVVTIAYLAEVTKVTEATASDDRKINLKVYDNTGSVRTVNGVYSDNFNKGDFLMVVPSANTGAGFQEPTSMTAAKVISDVKVTSYKADSVTFDGTTYNYSNFRNTAAKAGTSHDDTYNFNSTYDFYLDQFGHVVAAFTHTAGASTDYAYIVDVNGTLTTTIDGTTPAVEARVVLSDGTVGLYNIALEKVKSEGADNGDYKIKGTNITVYDKSEAATQDSKTVTAAAGALKTTGVYGYTVSDKTMTLESLSAGSASMTKDNVYSSAVKTIAKNQTSVKSNDNNVTVLLDSNTIYVLYNGDDKAATVYTGNGNLPKAFSTSAVKAVYTAKDTALGAASVVFADATVSAAATDNYVYIDASEFSNTWDGEKNIFSYEGIAADGSKVTVTAETKVSADGLYTYDEKNVLNTDKLTGAQYLGNTEQPLTVAGELLGVGGKYFNLTDDTQIVYVDNTLSEVNGNKGFVVLTVDGGDATNYVATIFVTSK